MCVGRLLRTCSPAPLLPCAPGPQLLPPPKMTSFPTEPGQGAMCLQDVLLRFRRAEQESPGQAAPPGTL